jgi:hypothetical protein
MDVTLFYVKQGMTQVYLDTQTKVTRKKKTPATANEMTESHSTQAYLCPNKRIFTIQNMH